MASLTREEIKVKKSIFYKVEYRNTPLQVIVNKVNTFKQKLEDQGLQQDTVLSWKALPDPSPVRPQHPVGMKISITIKHKLNLCVGSNIA